MLESVKQSIKVFLNSLGARIERYFRGREIVKVLKVAHAIELRGLGGEQWALTHQRHVQEIMAVKRGDYDIIDRRSWAYPYIPESLHRLNQPILKNTPYNLRRFSETPIPRRAIKLVRNGTMQLDWEVKPTKEALETAGGKLTPELQQKCDTVTRCLKFPNNKDSWRTLSEAVLEDTIIGGYGAIEPRITPDFKRPFKMWPIDGTTIRIYADWSESTPERPHYAQLTGLKGERGIISFRDDEISYLRMNVRSSTPFGLGCLEVCFNTVNAFLGVQDMATRSASDQVHKTWMWWEQPQATAFLQTVRRHIQNEIEGEGKTSLIAGFKMPQVLDVKAVQPDDLLLDWQQLLIRIVATGFDLSPQNFGLERDVNRNTSEVMSETDFKSAVVPLANLYAEHLNRDIIWGLVGWRDVEFKWIGLEDPDAETQAKIWGEYYKMNVLTPDFVLRKLGEPELPGGWGKLNQGQYMILQMAARASGQAGKGQQPGQGGPQGGGMSPEDIQQLQEEYTPEQIEQMQEQGLLPPMPSDEPPQAPQPGGILNQFSEEIQEFLDEQQKETQKRTRVKGKVNKSKLDKEQQQKFKKAEHVQTREEKQARVIEQRRQYALTHRPNNKRQGNQFTGRFR